ncbi:hypothetical protein F6V30_13905 [Oryzomonas sagensis]|uniref:Uncharacterized protein n=1 Tax=Oryzomonas sagensis TaxID=2603857 RepID=A0ABQ6TKZ5_9BACT|nr:hypothetical protein [Oryzomonas sagensis]KAB0668927.1 hypothetical protein F6V30_13905 [Oryzomonas sagensis]
MMGHSTKKMIDGVYGRSRKGQIDERERILDCPGDDFLSLEELKSAFPGRYQKKMAEPVIPSQIAKKLTLP